MNSCSAALWIHNITKSVLYWDAVGTITQDKTVKKYLIQEDAATVNDYQYQYLIIRLPDLAK